MNQEIKKVSKKDLIIYWITTGLVVFGMVAAAIFYIVKHDMVVENMKHLGYPPYLANILPFTKLLVAILLIFNKNKSVKDWVYSAYFCNCILATIAHGLAGDGWINPGSITTVLLTISYYYSNKVGK
ncbi:MAG: DoxX family protein [Bacteroidetes bacterium]|nr:MAG: DoxX family protein [Bacteroidota bacterium]